MARTFKQGVLIYMTPKPNAWTSASIWTITAVACAADSALRCYLMVAGYLLGLKWPTIGTWSMYRLGIWSGSGCVFLCNGQRMGFMVFLQTERGIFHWSLRRLYGSND